MTCEDHQPLSCTVAIPWWDLEIATPLADIHAACLQARNQYNETGSGCRMREETFGLMARNANATDLHGQRGLWGRDEDASELAEINYILHMNALPEVAIDPTVPDGVVWIDAAGAPGVLATIRT